MLEFPILILVRMIVPDPSFVLRIVKPVGDVNEDSRLISDDFVAVTHTGGILSRHGRSAPT